MDKFRNKRFLYGTLSTTMMIAAIGLFVFINIVADQFNISYDLTPDQMFSLSRGSINVIQELDQDITIYSLFPTGQENFLFQQLLEEYASNSNRITVINIDPVLNPPFVEQFTRPDEPIANGSIIVVGPNRHRVIHAEDLVTLEFNWQTFSNQIRSFDIEPQVTNAINLVVAEDSPVIYHVVGNGEFDLPPALLQEMEMAGYELRTVNLVVEEVPEDADILFITMPDRDWSPDQADRIREYLQNNGRAVFVTGYRIARFPRMDEVLASFGVKIGDYVIIEGNPNYFHMGNPLFLLPDFVPSEITDPLIERDFIPHIVQSTGIDILDMRRASTQIQPLIRTSNQAYGRNDPAVTVITRAPQDVDGPFNIAVMVEDSFFIGGGGTVTTRMVVIGSDFILGEGENAVTGGANWAFLMNSLDWLRERPGRVFIPAQPWPPSSVPLMMTQTNALAIMFVSLIALPAAFAVTGLVVWLRRRNA